VPLSQPVPSCVSFLLSCLSAIALSAIGLQGTLYYCRRLGVVPRLRRLLWAAALLYSFGLYSEVTPC
jgi:hypothetical protein